MQFNLKALPQAQVLSAGPIDLSFVKTRQAGHQTDALNAVK